MTKEISNFKLHVSVSRRGFSLVELLTVLGMMSILLSIGGLSLAGIRNQNHLDLVAAEVRTDLLRAQMETGNNNTSGLYFEQNRYTFFQGDTYVADDPNNEISDLPSNMVFSDIQLPNNTIVFERTTRYPVSYTDPMQVVVSDTAAGVSRTITINRWGVIEIGN